MGKPASKRSGENHYMYGKKHCEETRRKISEAISGENHPLYGKNFSEEHKRKISESLKEYYKNNIVSKETKRKISKAGKGRIVSSETRKKLSKLNRKENNSAWKGGVTKSMLVYYDTYSHQIDYAEEIRKTDDGILEIKCTYCGKWFIPKIYEVRSRIKSLEGKQSGESRIYCSDSCKVECPVYRQRDWPKGFKIATSREVQPQLRQLVFERDNYVCQKCGNTKSLHCHHKEGIRWNPLESADVDMCITYCKKCHVEVHKIDGCGYYELQCREVA